MELTCDVLDETTVIAFQDHYLDLSNSDALVSNVIAMVQNDRPVVFDLSRVDFVDSAGLGALMACRRHLLAAGTSLTLCCLSAKVRSVFEVARMHRLFSIAETRDAAMNPPEPAL